MDFHSEDSRRFNRPDSRPVIDCCLRPNNRRSCPGLLIERRSALNGLKLWAVNQAVYEIMLANNRAYIELVEINVKRAEIEPLVQSAINIMPCIRPIDQSVKAVAD